MYARMLAASIGRGARRKLLATASIALATLAATALVEVLLAAEDRLASDLAAYGANLEVRATRADAMLPAADLARLRKIFWSNNVVAFAPLAELSVRFPDGATAPLVGTWFDRAVDAEFRTGLARVRPTLAIDGRWPRDEGGEIVLGRRLAARLAAVLAAPLGSASIEVEIGERRARFAVVGTVESGGAEDDQAFVALSDLAQLGAPRDAYARAEVFALTTPEKGAPPDLERMSPEEYEAWYCTAYPSAIAHQIGEALPGSRAAIVPRITAATADVLGRLGGLLLALALVVLLGGGLGAGAAATATVLERRLEASLLTALGADRRSAVAFFLAEMGLLGLAGGALGGALGLFAGQWLGGAIFDVQVARVPALVPHAALAGLVLALLAALPAVLRALDRYPAGLLQKAAS